MTKEELKQDAIQFTKYYSTVFHVDDFLIYEAFLKIAEPRQKRIAELEKENAELKGIKDVATLIRANNDTVITLMQLNNKLVSKEQQLTKAKEILKAVVDFYPTTTATILCEAEKFISDIKEW